MVLENKQPSHILKQTKTGREEKRREEKEEKYGQGPRQCQCERLSARTYLDVFVRVSTGVVVAVRLECDRRHVPLLSYTLNPS